MQTVELEAFACAKYLEIEEKHPRLGPKKDKARDNGVVQICV